MGSGCRKISTKRLRPDNEARGISRSKHNKSTSEDENDFVEQGVEPDIEEKASNSLKETEDKLKSRGYEDPILAEYCFKSPAFFEEFTDIYGNIQKIRNGLLKEDFISLVEDPIAYMVARSMGYFNRNSEEQIPVEIFLVAIGFGELVRDLFDKIVSSYPQIFSFDREHNGENKTLVKVQGVMTQLTFIVHNYSYSGDKVCFAFSKAGMVSRLLEAILKLQDCISHQEQFLNASGHLTNKTARGSLMTNIMAVLNNLSKRVPVRATFNSCDAVGKLLPLIKDNKVPEYSARGLLILAYVIDESDNEIIVANEGPIKFLVRALKKAIETPMPVHMGLSKTEIVHGLKQIAINDNNKKLIVANDILPTLKPMISQEKYQNEKVLALELLWTLTFDDSNKIKIKEDLELFGLVKTLRHYDNKKVKAAASGVLWEIEDKQVIAASCTDLRYEDENKKHIMISYQWDVQKTLIQVKTKLQEAGFNVWMDLEQMGGSTLEAMAKAVENSVVVLVCMSQKYKESQNCRSEAEYAFNLKKDIVPLMMESNYKPDGWLGMILGSKFYHDFSKGQRTFEENLKALVKELGSRGKSEVTQKVVAAERVDTVDHAPVEKADVISEWSNEDVMNWIKPMELETKKVNTLHKLTGSMLVRLNTLKIQCPDYYYTLLKEDIGILDVCNAFRFTDELEKLISQI